MPRDNPRDRAMRCVREWITAWLMIYTKDGHIIYVYACRSDAKQAIRGDKNQQKL